MNVLILGSGKIGKVIASDLVSSHNEITLTLADVNEGQAEKAASEVEGSEYVVIDSRDNVKLVQLISKFDLVLGALPGDYGYGAMKAAVEAETDMVDVSYMPESPATLDEEAKQKNVTVIPDCGVAPGLSNILVGYSKAQLDRVNEVKIMVGGIPNIPVPPLDYTITWSVEGLIDEYVRPVKIVKNGGIIEVPPLTGLEEVEFPGLGKLEAFYTDGLRTLIDTIPNVELMWEKTLRYPGHVSKINLLRDLGFFSEEPIEINGNLVTPRVISSILLGKKLWMPDVKDLLVMRIEVSGALNGNRISLIHQLMEGFDKEKNISAMGRTTAYTASTVSGLLIKGLINRKGIFPPELLGANKELSKIFLKDLKEKGITIESQKMQS